MKRHFLQLLRLVLLLPTATMAIDQALPEATLPEMPVAPIIDGKLNPDEWTGSAGFYGVKPLERDHMFAGECQFRIGRHGEKLYIGHRSEFSPLGLKQTVPSGDQPPALLYRNDDTLEFVFRPTPQSPKLYALLINNLGGRTMTVVESGSGKSVPCPVESKGRIVGNRWEFEMALPLSFFGLNADAMPESSDFLFSRNWTNVVKGQFRERPTQGITSWRDGLFADGKILGKLYWNNNAAAVSVTSLNLPDGSGAAPVLELYNPNDTERGYQVSLYAAPASSRSSQQDLQLTVPPRQRKTVTIPLTSISRNEFTEARLSVTDQDKKTCYKRYFSWRVHEPNEIFYGTRANDIPFKSAYFPTHNAITVEVDLSGVETAKQPKKMEAVLYDPAGKELARTLLPTAVKGLSRLDWNIPDLTATARLHQQNPRFRLELKLNGESQPYKVNYFERHLMEWEGNKLGKSDRLIPPFTPIELDQTTLKTLLREHTLSSMGLPSRIKADGRELLAGRGIVLEAGVNGKTFELAASDFAITGRTPAHVQTKSTFHNAPLSGIAVADWDYDGMLKYTLTLNPTVAKVDSLKLIVPLFDAATPLIHANGDTHHTWDSRALPAGRGVIWSSDKFKQRELLNHYCPYIWLGNVPRGIALFGENDKGWLLDGKGAAQEIIREGDTVKLVYHLINKTSSWTNPRTITIGMLATPVKPMPKGWRRYGMGYRQLQSYFGTPSIFQDGDFSYEHTLLWGATCFGNLNAAIELEPIDGDFAVWQKIAETRKTRQVDQNFLKKWTKAHQYRSSGEEFFDVANKTRNDELQQGFRAVANGRGPLIAYTNARGGRFDTNYGKTFREEWFRLPFNRNYEFGGGVFYDVDPVESFRDYALWWYDKMLEHGVCDSLYWDDLFHSPNFKTVGTEAYVTDDGRIQPQVGVFNLRELVKRGTTLMVERGQTEPVTMMHHSMNAIAPLLSFGRIGYIWENNRGMLDFQDRYTREYLQAMSTGRQFGIVPAALAMFTSGSRSKMYDWVDRTATGVLLTHEIRWQSGTPSAWLRTPDGKLYTKCSYWDKLKYLLDFGYGKDHVNVWNYWDTTSYPARITGGKSASILISKPGEAILILCDWEKGGTYKVKLDLTALGLSGIAGVRDCSGNRPVQVTDDTLTFTLPRHDYIMLHLNDKAKSSAPAITQNTK